MSAPPVWLLPALLAVAQLTVWPGLPLLRGGQPGVAELAGGVALTVALAAALLFRRRHPVWTAAVAIPLVAVGTLTLPENAVAVIGLADLIAVYAVAVHRTARVTLAVTGAAVLVQTPAQLAAGLTPAEVSLVPVFYALVAAAGRIRSRWRADRAAAAQRLAEAEGRRVRAAEDERGRLARELHDVTAHHLTAIVVGSSAAERLAATRPELTAEALAAAGRTGRETLGALRRLVAIMRPGDSDGADLPGLAASLRELGRTVTVDADEVPPRVAEAAYAIAREALTNSLRYAPDAAITVTLRRSGRTADLIVDDHPSGTAALPVAGLGGGGGVRGMRERAAALGGSLTAGPRRDGGWRVHAVMPDEPGAPVPAARRPVSERVVDLALVVLVLAFPAAGIAALLEGPNPASATAVALASLAAVAHGIPLFWRRTRPVLVALVVAATAWLLPALIAAGLVPVDSGWGIMLALGADLMAVYAAGRWGRRPGLDWMALPVLLGSYSLAAGVTATLAPPEPDPGTPPMPAWVFAISISMVIGLVMVMPFAGVWGIGWFLRRRRDRQVWREDAAVAMSAHHALLTAGAERARVAAGLRAAVLRDAEALVAAADAGDLAGVQRTARSALDAMRTLLNDLREPPSGDRDPDPAPSQAPDRAAQPTLSAVPALAARWRAHGRELSVEVAAPERELPTDVEVSAYRVVELLLAADTGPARLRVEMEPLRITVSPAPPDPDGTIAAGLLARAAAAGGRITPVPGGLSVILVAAAQQEEVASSPSA